MTPSVRHRLLALGLALGISSSVLVATQQNQRYAWWKSEPFVKELGLTTDQTDRIDAIFQGMRSEARQELEELERMEAKLSRLIESDADEAMVVRQIDRVETARANLSKTRSLMLLRMRQVLTPDQRIQLTEIQKRREAENGRGPGSRSGGGPPHR